jgi:hypothetical protein
VKKEGHMKQNISLRSNKRYWSLIQLKVAACEACLQQSHTLCEGVGMSRGSGEGTRLSVQ